MEKSLAQQWEETKQIAKKRGYGCKNCKNRHKGVENDFVELCILTEREMPKNGLCEYYWLDEKALVP